VTGRYDFADGVEEKKLHPSLPLVGAILAFPAAQYGDDPQGNRRFRVDVSRWYRATRRLAVAAAKQATE
jgi:hypothetical protein